VTATVGSGSSGRIGPLHWLPALLFAWLGLAVLLPLRGRVRELWVEVSPLGLATRALW
jgi:hypothetical protein